MRLIVDANSWLNQALLRGTDHDEGRVVIDEGTGKPVQVNSARYGVDNFSDKFSEALRKFEIAPRDVLFVWDGRNAKLRRRTFLPNYKAGRDKHPAVSEQLNLAREQITQMAYHIGTTVIYQDGMEADDVIGYLGKHLRDQRNTIGTADGDLSVLHDDNTDVWRLGEMNVNPCGPFPHKYITLYKALVGDTSDKIPGAKGFGDEAWIGLVAAFGLEGLDAFIELIQEGQLDRLKEDVADYKPLQRVLDNKDMVYTSWRVASLMIDQVNTLKHPLTIIPGMVGQWGEVDSELRFEDLKHFYGTKTLVTAANYEAVRKRFARAAGTSPFVALDIETSTSSESDEWVEQIKAVTENNRERFDALGHELTGMSLTFGENSQHTLYMTVDHADSDNISVDQCRGMCEDIPKGMEIVIQNRQFEFTVLYRTWGEKWKNNGWSGFVPNAVDTKIGASYTNENYPNGLKERSKLHLGYLQTTYEQTTTLSGPVGSLQPGGEVKKTYGKVIKEAVRGPVFVGFAEDGSDVTEEGLIEPEVIEDWEDRQYKMRELTAQQVFDYGCDDTICTASLHTYYRLVMALENTLHIYYSVEQLPEYVTSLAFVQGIPVSMTKLREMERKDDARYDAAWATLRGYLLQHGWAGTVCPHYDELTPANVKEAVFELLEEPDREFKSAKRKLNALALDIRDQFDTQTGHTLASLVEANDVVGVNKLLKDNFTGEPRINFGSPKQMQNLFYRVMGIRPRLLNNMTEKQRDDPNMREAFKKFRRAKDARVDAFAVKEPTVVTRDRKEYKLLPLTTEEIGALIYKASTDDFAVEWALRRDELSDEQKAALQAFQTIKTVMTRRSLFYRTYKALSHWRDGRVHPSMNQCEAVTRRHSSSGPNAQQLPKDGDGLEFREIIVPHKKNAVVVSLDFNGQELRSIAFQSGDANLTACYVGDHRKDPHSLTAAAAAKYLWERELTYEEFLLEYKSSDKAVAKEAADLRKDAKTVNFGTNYDLQAPGLAVKMYIEEDVAQNFIDAKDEAMPGIPAWKDYIRKVAESQGYVETLLGARRHLQESLRSGNKWDIARAGRQGPNFAIQGSAAEQTKLALAEMWRRGLFTGRYDAVFYAPIHDEVVFSVTAEDACELIREVHECMTQPYGGMGPDTIPVVSTISLGPNFGVQHEIGEEPTMKAIREALDKVFKKELEAA